MRTIHFWPHDLRPAPEPLVVPTFDERLLQSPVRSLPVPEQVCRHLDRVSYGFTRSRNPRFRCRTCKRTFVQKPGNNNLKPAKAEALRAALLSGVGARAAARMAGVAHMTAAHYRRQWCIEATCPCGQVAGHQGWCAERFRNSPAQQAVLAKLHARKCTQALDSGAEMA